MRTTKLTHYSYAAETIGFQNDKTFPLKLDAWCKSILELVELQDRPTWNQEWPKLREAFTALIKERFGLIVDPVPVNNVASPLSIMPFYLNNRNTLLKRHFHGKSLPADMVTAVKRSMGKHGNIHLGKAKVDGIYSEYKHKMYADFFTLGIRMRFEPRELAAAICHELGHPFTIYEYADRVDSQNQVLAQLVLEVSKPDFSTKKVNTLLSAMQTEGLLTEDDRKLIIDSESKIVLGSKTFEAIYREAGSQTQLSKYDDTSSEQLADAFSARLGYYKELVSGLDKFHIFMGAPEKSRLGWWAVFYLELNMFVFRWYLLSLFLFFTVFQYAGIGLGLLLAALTSLIGMLWMVWLTEGDNTKDMTYDGLFTRYERIKHQAIQQLKDPDLDEDIKRQTLSAIASIDLAQADTTDFKSVFSIVINFLSPAARTAKAGIELEKLVEGLVHNPLFISSAELTLTGEHP